MEYHGSSYESVAQAWPEISNSFPGEEFHYPQFTALAVQNIYANPSDAAAIPMQRIYQHTFFKQQTNVWLNHGIFEKWFGQRGFSPVEHVGAPADGVVTLSPGLNLIAPPTNSHAKILFSVQRPVIKL